MVPRNEERAVRDIGRTALEKAAKAALDTVPPGISRRFATVTRLYGNGTCDVDMGSASSPQPMLGLRMTAGCMGVSVGSRVIVDTVSHVSLVTGVLANDNLPYVLTYSGTVIVSFSENSETVQVWDNATFRKLFPGVGDFPYVGFSLGDNNFNSWSILGALQVRSGSGQQGISNGDAIFCQSSRAATGLVRLNYVVVGRT